MENIVVHPLVIINISDHFTRGKFMDTLVIGALFGTQEGQRIEIFNSFELPITSNVVDLEYFTTKQELYHQVFPNLSFLGWYGMDFPNVDIHRQFLYLNESPLYLQLIVETATLQIFDSLIDLAQEPYIKFTPIKYRIESSEAERIAVEHVTHFSAESKTASSSIFS
jgi:COP9 signalosome complex subunit 6